MTLFSTGSDERTNIVPCYAATYGYSQFRQLPDLTINVNFFDDLYTHWFIKTTAHFTVTFHTLHAGMYMNINTLGARWAKYIPGGGGAFKSLIRA